MDKNGNLSNRATFRFGINRSSANKRVRYVEGTQIDPNECILCVPDLNDNVVDLDDRMSDEKPNQSPS
ncbi:hypothetical protein D3C77_413480 [compost metagenome]